jgi:hypothetical protein
MDQIRYDVEHTFFAQTLAIDEQRISSRELMEKWLFDAGFISISSQEVMQQTFETGAAYLDAARSKNTSVLSMISEESFQNGIHRLTEYVEKNPSDEWLLFDKMTLTVGHRKE